MRSMSRRPSSSCNSAMRPAGPSVAPAVGSRRGHRPRPESPRHGRRGGLRTGDRAPARECGRAGRRRRRRPGSPRECVAGTGQRRAPARGGRALARGRARSRRAGGTRVRRPRHARQLSRCPAPEAARRGVRAGVGPHARRQPEGCVSHSAGGGAVPSRERARAHRLDCLGCGQARLRVDPGLLRFEVSD